MKPTLQTIAWDDKLATGLTDIDSQHQRLFDLTNQLAALHASSATAEPFSKILNELNLQLQSEIDRCKQLELELRESKARFRTMADHTHSWEYWQGVGNNILYMSPSCERITGYTADEFAADPELLYRIIHSDDQHLMEEHRHDIVTGEEDEEEIGFRIIRRDGEIRWIIHTCKALYDSNADFIGRRGSNRDITDRKTQNDSMLLVATVFESVNEAVLLTNADNRIVMVNTSFTNITGYAAEELIGMDPGVLGDVVPDPEVVKVQWEKLTAKGRWQGEMINRRKNGELYAAWVSIDSVRDESGEVGNFILVFSDISERKENERRIHYLAHYDQLTGLPNWTLLCDRIQQALLTAKRNGTCGALMFVDIDHFKQVKDQIGHLLGDLLLKEAANRLLLCLQESDTAARIGSDEFVVLLPAIEQAQDADLVANKILNAMAEPFLLNEHTLQISTSIGIALFPDHGDSIGHIMKSADLAMYQAKRAGGAVAISYAASDQPSAYSTLS